MTLKPHPELHQSVEEERNRVGGKETIPRVRSDAGRTTELC
jgi:hypothetical protein